MMPPSKILKLDGLAINSVVVGKKDELVLAPRGKCCQHVFFTGCFCGSRCILICGPT